MNVGLGRIVTIMRLTTSGCAALLLGPLLQLPAHVVLAADIVTMPAQPIADGGPSSHSAKISPGAASEHPSLIAAPAGDDAVVQTIGRLVIEHCQVTSSSIEPEADAYLVELSLGDQGRDCLNDIVVDYDRLHAGQRALMFHVGTDPIQPTMPIMHISSIDAGPMPYIRLRDGRTLFLGAIVNGWTLERIDARGAQLVRGEQQFVLTLDDEVRP
jgi:hypothetical protein